jgi:hypothetical protein
MKAKTIIVLNLFLFLAGFVITGYSQGITNSGGYITGNSSSYIKFSGSGDMTLKSTTADRTTFGNMVVDFTGSGTYKLTIPDDSYITVDGNLTLSDTLLLKASSSGMASLITNGTVSGSYAKVEQYLTQDQWHIISSPVSSATANVYLGIYLMKWNEPDSTWSWVTQITDPLNVTQGYFAWSSSGISSPTTVTFDGLLNTGNQTVASLTYNNNAGEGHGWNLVGNTYPSAVEWNNSWTKTNIDATIYIYDGTQYKTWNYNLPAISNTLPNGEIPSTQGFWVKANASGPSMAIPNGERCHTSNSFYKGSDVILPDAFSIEVTGNGYSDQACFGMHPEATEDFDSEYDAYKLFGIEAAPQLYSFNNDTKFAVNLFPEITENKVIPLGLKTGAAMEYTIEAEGLDNFNPSTGVYLEDNSTGSLTNLRENPVYTFNAEEGLDEERFVLHFIVDNTDIELTETENNISIYAFNNTVYVNYQLKVPGNVVVYDMVGKEIISENLNPDQLNKLTVNHGKGYYIVKVFSEEAVKTEKVFIN